MDTSDPTAITDDDAPVEVRIERAGLATEVLVTDWLVAEGGAVSLGDPIAVVESEKTEFEITAPATGRIEILVPASDSDVAAGAVIARIHR